jgi:ankyrin repeat protein
VAERLGENTTCALHHYAATGDIQLLLLLHRHLLNVPDNQGDTALHIAVINHQVAALKNMLIALRTLPSPSSINAHNNREQTPLHLAVITKQSEIVVNLMASGADVSLIDKHGNTALHLAAQSDPQCLQAILTTVHRQAWPELVIRNYKGHTALDLAVLQGKLECVKNLVLFGANVNQPDGTTGCTPLHMAVEMNNVAIAGHLLLECKADANAPSFSGNTPLHVAVGNRNLTLAALLVSVGADPNLENYEPIVAEEDLQVIAGQLTGHTAYNMAEGNEKMTNILNGSSRSSGKNTSPLKDINVKEEVDIDRIDSGISSLSLQSSELNSKSLKTTPTPWRLEPSSPKKEITRKITNDNILMNHNEGGDMYLIDLMTRDKLSGLLDPLCPGQDWIALAEWLDMGILIEAFRSRGHPTLCLLNEYEDGDGTVKQLLEVLSQMKRDDAVSIIDDAFNIHKGSQGNKNISKSSEWLTSGDSTYGSMTSSSMSSKPLMM